MTTRTRRKSYGVNRDSWTVLEDLLTGTPEEFNPDGHTLRGRAVNYTHRGHLPHPTLYSAALDVSQRDGTLDYVIYSYQTPIAWRVTVKGVSYWVAPPFKYSVTTSKHQGRVNTALHRMIKQEWPAE